MTEASQAVLESFPRRLGGRFVLAGMVSLFVGLLLFIAGMFLLYRMSAPIGGSFLTAGKAFAVLWFPLVLIGAFLRIVNPEHSASSDRNVGGQTEK